MQSIKITNPNVFTPPDVDSDIDYDSIDLSDVFKPTKYVYTYKHKMNLIKLGCALGSRDDYKLKLKRYPRATDEQYASKYKEHLQKLQEQRQKYLEEENKKREQARKEAEEILASLKKTALEDKDEDDDDEAFEEELRRQNELIEAAIKYDKERTESELAAEKEREEKEKKQKEEEEKKRKAEAEKKEKELKLQRSSATSPEGLEEYKKHYAKIEYFKATLKPKLANDPTFRKQIFEARRLVKRTVAQLQYKHNVILEKVELMYNHLTSIKAQSQEAFEVLLNFLAKAFLAQVKQEVHATPFAAYFLARFAYLLISTIPEFLDYLMGRLYKRCPYLIPQYHDDDPTLAVDEIKRRLRYDYTNKEDKTFQTFLQHAEQQKCYVMFYGALCQTKPDPGQPENRYPIKHAWVWLARICNMPPREITPILVLGLLEVSAERLLEAYPTQTPKLFRLIREKILPMYPKCDNNDNVGGITRLEMFLDDYFKTGQVKCISESLPAQI
ncbi:Nuclear pore complex nucleoporin component [Rhizopus azygosporus]|uniref:mRNA export factor GLE1 n=1 Tax=Rhizopus azygosporus TaxID=86630 RepID=A0A367K6H6_RHIAZ|nr:Nuclear pore complex nucleoporin component [Rhizopus azygosporus]